MENTEFGKKYKYIWEFFTKIFENYISSGIFFFKCHTFHGFKYVDMIFDEYNLIQPLKQSRTKQNQEKWIWKEFNCVFR